jgi:predicted kinase
VHNGDIAVTAHNNVNITPWVGRLVGSGLPSSNRTTRNAESKQKEYEFKFKGLAVIERVLSELVIPSTRWSTPVLIGIFGVPCAGKTEVARYLEHRYPLLVLSTDALRLRYGFESGIDTRQVMDQVAAQLLPQQVSIVFDGIHLRRKDRQAVRQLADAHQVDVYLIYVVADADLVEQRLQARMQRAAEVTAEGKFIIPPEHFNRIVSYLEPPTPNEATIVVDTSHDQWDEQLDSLNQLLQRRLLTAS